MERCYCHRQIIATYNWNRFVRTSGCLMLMPLQLDFHIEIFVILRLFGVVWKMFQRIYMSSVPWRFRCYGFGFWWSSQNQTQFSFHWISIARDRNCLKKIRRTKKWKEISICCDKMKIYLDCRCKQKKISTIENFTKNKHIKTLLTNTH